MSRFVIFLLGLIAVALLIFLCIRKHTPVIQKDIQARTSSALSSVPTEWAKVNVDGRNVILTGQAPSQALREKAGEIAKAIPGVVSVDNQITIDELLPESTPELESEPESEPVTIHSPYKSLFTKTTSGIVLSGLVPDEEHRKALLQIAEEKFGVGNVTDQLQIGSGAPEGWQQAAVSAITHLALFNEGTVNLTDTQIDLSGHVIDDAAKNTIEAELQNQLPDNFKIDLDLMVPHLAIEEIHPEPLSEDAGSTCEQQFKKKLAGHAIHFSTDSAGVKAQAQTVLDKVMEYSASCPNSLIEVAGYTDARGNDSYNIQLSKNRAKAVVNKLVKRGMRADRLKAAGYGEANPLSNNNTRKGRADNRRIEFTYLQEGE